MIAENIKKDFIKAVGTQEALFRELRTTIDLEEKSLMKKDITSLDSIVAKEEEVLIRIEASEKEKNRSFAALVAAAGLGGVEDAKIKDVLLKIGDEGREIEKALLSLVETVKLIDTANSKNIHVLKNFLEYTGFIKAAKEKIEHPVSTTYDSKGYKKQEKPEVKRINIDKKI